MFCRDPKKLLIFSSPLIFTGSIFSFFRPSQRSNAGLVLPCPSSPPLPAPFSSSSFTASSHDSKNASSAAAGTPSSFAAAAAAAFFLFAATSPPLPRSDDGDDRRSDCSVAASSLRCRWCSPREEEEVAGAVFEPEAATSVLVVIAPASAAPSFDDVAALAASATSARSCSAIAAAAAREVATARLSASSEAAVAAAAAASATSDATREAAVGCAATARRADELAPAPICCWKLLFLSLFCLPSGSASGHTRRLLSYLTRACERPKDGLERRTEERCCDCFAPIGKKEVKSEGDFFAQLSLKREQTRRRSLPLSPSLLRISISRVYSQLCDLGQRLTARQRL